MHKIFGYIIIWKKLTVNSFLISLSSRVSALLFLTGKLLRFIFFFIFLSALFGNANTLAGYTSVQILLFFMTFNLIDTVTQLFFREAYRFRPLVVSGDFDLILVKPMNPLFRALAGGADPLDLIMLIPYTVTLVIVISRIPAVTITSVVLYCLLVINGLIIATGFHIIVLALAILTTEIDNTIMIYRDLTSMGRFPVDIYKEPIRTLILYIVPVGIMMTIPAKAMLGLLYPGIIFTSVLIGGIFFVFALKFWAFALTKYTSASS